MLENVKHNAVITGKVKAENLSENAIQEIL